MKDYIAVRTISREIENLKINIAVRYNNGDGEVWRMPADTDVIIGRDGEMSNIGIRNNKQISSQHCIVRYIQHNQLFQVTDVSDSGTYCNGGRLQKDKPYRLKPGSLLVLGDRACAVELEVKP